MPLKHKIKGNTTIVSGKLEELNPYSLKLRYGERSDEALEILKKALSLDSHNEKLWTRICDLYLMRNEFDNAIDACSEALLNHPKSKVIWYFLGLAYLLNKERRNNRKTWAQINLDVHWTSYIDKNLSLCKTQLAEVYAFKKEEYEKAIKLCKEALEIDVDRVFAWYILGHIYFVEENYNKAIEAFKMILSIDPENKLEWNARSLNYLSYIYIKINEFPKAVEAARRALSIDTNLKEAWGNLAAAYFEQEEYDKVINVCHRALEIDVKNEGAWGNLARTYNKLRDYDNAIATAMKALDVKPELSRALHHLGYAYYMKGDIPKALELMRWSLDLEPEYELAQKHLKQIQNEVGEVSFNGIQTDIVRKILREREQKPIRKSNEFYKLARFFYTVRNYKKAHEACDISLKLNPNNKKAIKLNNKIQEKC
ncbi:MAG: tetratricopeptide repeat protein [Promethearchaeota archaeon]